MWLPYKIFFIILHTFTLPLQLFLFALFVIYKQVVCLLANLFHDFVGCIPSSSYVFLGDKIWTKPYSTVIVAINLEGNFTQDVATKLFEKAYNFRDKNGRRCYREFGYQPVVYFGHGFWKKLANFKISCLYYLEAQQTPIKNVDRIHVLKNDFDSVELNDNAYSSSFSENSWLPLLSDKLVRKPFEKNQPLWDVYLVHNNPDKPTKTVMVIRFHHLMADGMSLVKFCYALTGSLELPKTFTKPQASLSKWDQMASYNIVNKLATTVTILTVGVVEYIYQVLFHQDKNPINFFSNGQSKISGEWKCAMGKKFNMKELKIASKFYKCSIVHIILSGVSSGVEKYIRKYYGNESPTKGFYFLAALPRPNHPNMRFVNHWCAVKLYSQIGIKRATEKLEYFREETKQCSKSTFPILSACLLEFVCGKLPCTILDMFSNKKAHSTVLLSNVVGPQEETIGGLRISDMMFWMPIAREIAGLSVGAISCNNGFRVCITADVGCVPENKLDELAKIIDMELFNTCKIS